MERHRPRRRRDGTTRYRFSLRKYGNGHGAWVAQFNGDVATSAGGFGSGATPWKATQQAAWNAVKKVGNRPGS